MKSQLLFIVFALCIISCRNKAKEIKDTKGHVFYDRGRKELLYGLKDNKKICLSIERNYLSGVDSTIIESYDLNSPIDYNQFPEPQIECFTSGTSINGKLGGVTFSSLKPEEFMYFVRIFDESFKDYIKENKINILSEDAYIQFQKEHSYLVPLEYKDTALW
jgi:hypothetical protein